MFRTAQHAGQTDGVEPAVDLFIARLVPRTEDQYRGSRREDPVSAFDHSDRLVDKFSLDAYPSSGMVEIDPYLVVDGRILFTAIHFPHPIFTDPPHSATDRSFERGIPVFAIIHHGHSRRYFTVQEKAVVHFFFGLLYSIGFFSFTVR